MFATKIGTSGSGRRWRLAAITVLGTEGMPYYENHPARGTRRRVNTATMAGEGITAAQETERFHFHLLICIPFPWLVTASHGIIGRYAVCTHDLRRRLIGARCRRRSSWHCHKVPGSTGSRNGVEGRGSSFYKIVVRMEYTSMER